MGGGKLIRTETDPMVTSQDVYRRMEALLQGQADVLDLISHKVSLPVILEAIARWVENHSYNKSTIASILLLDAEGKHLLYGAAPGLPQEFSKAIHGLPIGPAAGSCGTAAFTRETVVTEDIQSDPIWKDLKDLALKFDLKSCWSTPLISKAGKIHGTFALYSNQRGTPTAADLQMIHLVNRTVVLAIEHSLAEAERDRLQASEARAYKKAAQESKHFKRLLMNAPAIIAVLKGPEHIYELANPSYMETVGPEKNIIGKSVKEAFPELVPQGVINLLDHVYQSGRQFIANEMPITLRQKKDGELRDYYFNFVYQPLKSDTDEVEGILVHAIDVTEQVKAKRALQESEKRLRSMIEQAPVAISLMKGREMIIKSANDLMLELWGKSRQILGMPLAAALPEIKGQGFTELLEKVYDTGIPHYGYETAALLNRRTGMEEAYFNFVYAPIRETGDHISGIMAVATEVTSQVQAKKALEASEKRFRSFILSSPMPIAIYIGRDMVIQIANNAMLKTWGRDSSILGKRLRDVLPELEEQPFLQLLDNVYTTGIPYRAYEDRVDLLRGNKIETFYYNFTYKALLDGEGNIYGVINNATDVTPLVHARQKLEETQQRLHIAIESAHMGMWSINPMTNEVTFSDRLKELYGFSGGEVDMATSFSVIHKKDRGNAVTKLQQAMRPGSDGSYKDEFTIVNLKTGQERVIRSVGKALFNEEGKAYLVVGSVLDITDQKMIEQELELRVEERTLALKEANQHLEQFAYVISHDLQEPLRKIRTFSDILQARHKNKLDTSVQGYLQKIETSATRVTALIRDLLEFSRIGSQRKEHVRTDLREIIENIKGDFNLLAAEKNALINIDRLPEIDANPVQMNQLFYNLIGNALKFTKDGRRPIINITSRTLTREEILSNSNLNPSRRYCEIIVSDNGIGFEQQFADTIFIIFQQLHPRNLYKGTGTGLAICKKIVTNHQGEIYARGEKDAGASFYVILPIEKDLSKDIS